VLFFSYLFVQLLFVLLCSYLCFSLVVCVVLFLFVLISCYLFFYICCLCGTGSSVGMATDDEPYGPGSNASEEEEIHPSRPAMGQTQSPLKYVPVFPGVKCARGVLLATHPF
jgi:hypothetical protein